jgi:hypothetical protein
VQSNPICESLGLSHLIIASTSTASYSPKIKFDVIGSKPSASPKGFGRSPTMTFPGAVKTFTLSVFVATGVVTRVVSFQCICAAHLVVLSTSERVTVQSKIGRNATTNPSDERIDQDQSTGSTLQPGRPKQNIRNRLNPNPIRAER